MPTVNLSAAINSSGAITGELTSGAPIESAISGTGTITASASVIDWTLIEHIYLDSYLPVSIALTSNLGIP